MAVLLQINGASKSYGEQVLLDRAEATITDEAKVGFVGRNGAGKSTLLRILLGEEELDRGVIVRHPKLRLGYLRQHDPFLPGETVLEYLIRDSGQPDWKCGEVAGDFELKGAALTEPVAKLSGGWQTRVKLAALLLHDPNLLLLDEPTNFLDLRTQILLEHFLREHREACLVVSHDRAFLRATCDHTLDLSHGKLTMYPGKIDAFLEYQRGRREHDLRVNASTLAKQRHLEDFIARNKARASTASRAKSKAKQLQRLELIETASDEPTAMIRAPSVEPRKGPALRCRELTIGYPKRVVAEKIDLEIDHGWRAAVVGDNGQGKTTFLRTVVDSLPPLAGEVRWGYGSTLGIYAQHVYTSLPEAQTVLDYLQRQAASGTKDQTILDTAAALLFRGEQINKRIGVLSGGERARLCLAGLLLGPYNVLVLDEPGNHLDVDTVEALAEALLEYRGTVIFTSHDRHFLQRVATCIVEVRDSRVVNYRGNYDAYLYAVTKEIDDQQCKLADKSKSVATNKSSSTRIEPSKSNQRELRKQAANLEKSISRLEERKQVLQRQLMDATDPADALRLHDESSLLAAELTEAEERWLQLHVDLQSG
ncbi:MAG: ABC-F family ATP-binding cassette domain-containing protein [Pirellulales bacterium]|nr:ABC-F family ATP-binding cassette domain-containing protein [Pirellulales bacterium]